MYHPGKTQPDYHLATLNRTFYPKHVGYFGAGCGRDGFIIINNGGLNRVDKQNLGHTGVHLKQYNVSVTARDKPTPRKEPTTFYYQSDGTGRDSYVLKNNGGYRMEYDLRTSGDRIFKDSLRNSERAVVNAQSMQNPSNITNYLNWSGARGI